MRDSFWRDPLIWVLVGLALVVRIVYNLALHPDGHPPQTFVIDEREYFGAAHVLAEGRGFSFFDKALWIRPPLYVATLGAVMSVAGDAYTPELFVQSLLGALTLPALGWLAFRVAGRKAARWAILLGLLYLPFTLFAGLLLSETLFVFLFAWSLVLLVLARETLAAGWSRVAWVVSIGAGVLLGMGVLTRSTALGFVPLAMLWLAWDKRLAVRQRVLAPLAVLGVCLLTLVPWIARNYSAYGRFVPVDTTGGYNLWLGSVGVRDEARLQADLLAIPNPADRQGYAISQALDNIAADPLKFAGKGIKESFDLWRPSFSAEERQVRGYALGRVPDWHLLSLFLFDDSLYLVILLLAVIGLAMAPPNPLKGLTGLWVLLWVATAFVFFAVTRFRLPIIACLVPWAGIGLSYAPTWRARTVRLPRRTQIVGVLALIAALLVVIPAIQPGETWRGMARWGEQAPYRIAENLLMQGQAEQAIEQYELANTEISDTRYGLAAALIQAGRANETPPLFRADDDPDRFEPSILMGEMDREQGNLPGASASFNARVVQVAGEAALDWAWDHLNPPPTTQIDIGSGLDIGYVRGFYGPEKDAGGKAFRWTGPRAEIRGFPSFIAGAITPITLTLELNGWRPVGAPGAELSVTSGLRPPSLPGALLNGQDVWSYLNLIGKDPDFLLTNMPPPHHIGEVVISSRPFVPGGDDPRLLGLRASTVRIVEGR